MRCRCRASWRVLVRCVSALAVVVGRQVGERHVDRPPIGQSPAPWLLAGSTSRTRGGGSPSFVRRNPDRQCMGCEVLREVALAWGAVQLGSVGARGGDDRGIRFGVGGRSSGQALETSVTARCLDLVARAGGRHCRWRDHDGARCADARQPIIRRCRNTALGQFCIAMPSGSRPGVQVLDIRNSARSIATTASPGEQVTYAVCSSSASATR